MQNRGYRINIESVSVQSHIHEYDRHFSIVFDILSFKLSIIESICVQVCIWYMCVHVLCTFVGGHANTHVHDEARGGYVKSCSTTVYLVP